ncbi:hypothetical protein NE237_005905 [Protea cynaroides]|uniref:Uncharacterized protein n=1 Tax=Protea cynaroides TaxID=273540 RepID=A0A9Q0KLK2_9MAGN|nr:hypothetical protein NE237_005905 [Protea cynaroides]
MCRCTLNGQNPHCHLAITTEYLFAYNNQPTTSLYTTQNMEDNHISLRDCIPKKYARRYHIFVLLDSHPSHWHLVSIKLLSSWYLACITKLKLQENRISSIVGAVRIWSRRRWWRSSTSSAKKTPCACS